MTVDSRPKTFAEMVGQERTLAVLRSLLATDSLPSTFLFSGCFGSGKTSSARILAAMVNCENPDNKDACGECYSCVTIAEGKSDALVEIDSAVYGSADNVRTLTELVDLAVPAQYRVVILDEAHALSKTAFNALLKVMEESPQNVIFVLVTTELRKIPDTVRSRAVSFYFGPIPSHLIAQRLHQLCDQYGITHQKDALKVIADSSDSMRDAVKNLDVLATVTDKNVTESDAQKLVGDSTIVKNVLRKTFSHSLEEDDLEDMFAYCSPTLVLEVMVNVLTLLHQRGTLDVTKYTKALDIVWSLTPVSTFDSRGKLLVRLAMMRLEAVFPDLEE